MVVSTGIVSGNACNSTGRNVWPTLIGPVCGRDICKCPAQVANVATSPEGNRWHYVALSDPRVAQAAAKRHAFELMLQAVIEDSGLAQSDEALFDSWDALNPATADVRENEAGQSCGRGEESMSMVEATGKMPYDYSPARLRCMELAEELAADEYLASHKA